LKNPTYANWSAEIFKVITIFHTNPITYGLAEYNGERVEGSFYEQELQKTDLTDVFLVEKVIQKRKGEVLVKWLGWSESYNSWIKESELKNFKCDASDTIRDINTQMTTQRQLIGAISTCGKCMGSSVENGVLQVIRKIETESPAEGGQE